MITDQIIESLSKGVIPWKKPWSSFPAQNYVSGTVYTGINALLLNMLGYDKPYFLTYKQAQSIGGQVKRGAKSHIVTRVVSSIYDKQTNKRVSADEAKQRDDDSLNFSQHLKHFRVFHYSDVEGVDFKIPEGLKLTSSDQERLKRGMQIFEEMENPPQLVTSGNRAYYVPAADYINMPNINAFESTESFLSVFYHELTHSSGHKSRLNREGITVDHNYSDKIYSREELIAEIGSAYLMHSQGFSTEKTMTNHTGYIQGWLKVLKNDPKMIVKAATHAQRSTNYILKGS